MPQEDAVEMDNFISTGGYVKLRGGTKCVLQSKSGVEAQVPVQTLCKMTYQGEEQIIYGYKNPAIECAFFYKTDSDFVNPVDIVKKTNGVPDFVINGAEFKDLQFEGNLFLVSNGTDAPLIYNGTGYLEKTGFSAAEVDGLHLEDLCDLTSYNQRLFFVEKGTLRLWFTKAAGAITGVLENNDLSFFAKKGGEIVEVEEWTRSAANNLVSMLVVITSQGEVFMFQGTDPGDPDEWSMEGIYQIPTPIGYQCTTKMLDDLVFSTKSGQYTTQALTKAVGTTRDMALSDKIKGAIDGLAPYWESPGWQIIFLNTLNYLLINIPVSEVKAIQFVLNCENNTWTRFTGIDAFSFCTVDDKVYYGGKQGGIFELFNAGSDNGISIPGSIEQASSLFGIEQNKHVKAITVNLAVPYRTEIRLRIVCDFKPSNECAIWTRGGSAEDSASRWDTSIWDVSAWGVYTEADGLTVQTITTEIDSDISRYVGVVLRIRLVGAEKFDFVWYSTTLTYEIAAN
jgi:hypothetical protein